jgi:hypothetical protein
LGGEGIPGALAAPGSVLGDSGSCNWATALGTLEPRALPLDLLAALSATRWLGRDFMNSTTWRVAVVTGGWPRGRTGIPLSTTREQYPPTTQAAGSAPIPNPSTKPGPGLQPGFWGDMLKPHRHGNCSKEPTSRAGLDQTTSEGRLGRLFEVPPLPLPYAVSREARGRMGGRERSLAKTRKK